MLTHETACELSRERVRHAEARANLTSRLGDLPKPHGLPLFRREVKPLAGVVEARRFNERSASAGG